MRIDRICLKISFYQCILHGDTQGNISLEILLTVSALVPISYEKTREVLLGMSRVYIGRNKPFKLKRAITVRLMTETELFLGTDFSFKMFANANGKNNLGHIKWWVD